MPTVKGLLAKPFLSRSYEKRVDIVVAGKPRPDILEAIHSSQGACPPENITSSSLYDQIEWLTGSDKTNSFYCWPCLLFTEEHIQWNQYGMADWKLIQTAVMRHSKTAPHAQAVLVLQMFQQRISLQKKKGPSMIPQDDHIKRNRELFRCIIDTACHVATEQYPAHLVSKTPKQLLEEECVNSFQLLTTSSASELNVSKDVVNLLKTFPSVLTDVLCAVTSVMKECIKSDVRQSAFASIILNGHSDDNMKSKISTVLRYVVNGEVREKFVGFTNFNVYKTSRVIYEHIGTVVKEFNISEKLVGFSCDGGVLESAYHLSTLKRMLTDDYPFFFFAPCHFHELNAILEQRLEKIKECNLFLKNVNSVRSFFVENPKACSALNEFLSLSVQDIDEWSNSRFLRFLKGHRRQFIQLFKSVGDHFESWGLEDLLKALGFQVMLQEFDTIFLLEAFSRIFEYTSELNNKLSSILTEAVFGSDLPTDLQKSLEAEREETAFDNFWINVVCEILESQEPKSESLKATMEPDMKLLYREFYLKIVDCVITEIDNRFGHLNEMVFFHILNCEKHGQFVVCNEYLNSLLIVRGRYFNNTRLYNEMKVFCRNRSMFAGKSLYELVDLFVSANLQTTFANLFKVAELALTLPCKPPSPAAGTSKLDKIRPWCWVSENEEIRCDFSSICIEHQFLEEMRDKENFLNDILTKFQETNKTVDLVFF